MYDPTITISILNKLLLYTQNLGCHYVKILLSLSLGGEVMSVRIKFCSVSRGMQVQKSRKGREEEVGKGEGGKQ